MENCEEEQEDQWIWLPRGSEFDYEGKCDSIIIGGPSAGQTSVRPLEEMAANEDEGQTVPERGAGVADPMAVDEAKGPLGRTPEAVTESWEEVKPRLPQNIREPTKHMIIDHEASGHAVFARGVRIA